MPIKCTPLAANDDDQQPAQARRLIYLSVAGALLTAVGLWLLI